MQVYRACVLFTLERNLDIIFRPGEAPDKLSSSLSETHTRDLMARQNSQHRSLGARKAAHHLHTPESPPSPLAWATFTEWGRAEYPKTCCTGSSQEVAGQPRLWFKDTCKRDMKCVGIDKSSWPLGKASRSLGTPGGTPCTVALSKPSGTALTTRRRREPPASPALRTEFGHFDTN